MTTWFYPGQEDYITKLNELGAIAELVSGPDGWSPVLAVVSDGERRVFQIADWVGGETAKPATGGYVGSTGIVGTAALAVDIRGPQGTDGSAGPSNVLSIGTVTGGASASATITGTSPSQVLNLVLPKGDPGDPGVDGSDGVAATIAVGTVTTGAPGTSATVVNSGTSSAAVFDFTIPRGDPGSGSGTGDVVGPATAVNNSVALFDGTTGKLLKAGGVLGTAAFESATSFATSSQGSLADTAVQPGDLATVATTGAYSDLTGKPTLGTASGLNVAVTGNAASGEVVKGDDTRLTDSRTPTGTAGGVLSGTYPNPGFAVDMATQAELDVVSGVANSKLSDAPSDGKTYGRKDAAWTEIVSSGTTYQTGDSLTTSRTLSTPDWVEAGKVYLQSSYPALYALAGDSATSVFDGLSTDQGQAPAAICAASSTVLVSVGGGGTSTRSEDAGASWARVTGPNTSDFFNAVCAPSSTVVVAVGTAGVVWRSTNAGVSWTKITGPNTTDRLQSVAALTSTALVAVGQSGVVWTSSNGGSSWAKITGPNTTDNLISVVALSSTVAVAVSTTGAQWKTTNAGANWTRTVAATGVSLSSLCALDANTLVAVGSSNFTNTSIIRSIDAGASWNLITPINTTTNLQSVTALNASDVIAVGYRGVIWRSKDAGATWFAVGEFDKPSRSASLTCVASTSGNLVVAAGSDNSSLTGVVWRAGGFQHDPFTQFVTPYTRAAQAGMKQYIKA